MSQQTLSRVLKGVYSALVAFLGGLAAILTGTAGFTDVRSGQWVTILLSAVLAFGGTFGLAPWPGPRINGGTPPGQ